MNRAALLVVGIVAAGCYHRREVQRADWPAMQEDLAITVKTLDGATRRFDGFLFTTAGLSGWRLADSTRTDSVLVPLDSIAVVRVSEFNRAGTLMLVAAATTAAFVILQATKSDVRPDPVPRPPSSCPFVYSYDGKDWILDSETYAGAIARGMERTDVDNLDHLRAVDGRYHLRVRNDRPETDYTDEMVLLSVDHPAGTRAIPDAENGVHLVGTGSRPTATLEYGGDTIPSRAGWELAFPRPRGVGDTVALVLRARNSSLAPFVIEHTLSLLGSDIHAWYASMRGQLVMRAAVRGWLAREGYLEVRAATGDSSWRTIARLPDVGAALAKTNVVLVDLTGVVGDTIRVRLESSPGLWLLHQAELAPYHGRATTRTLRAARATDDDGAEIGALLSERDGKYLVATQGRSFTLEYDAPPSPAGGDVTRTILLRTTGHYYMETNETLSPRRDIVDRLMSDRAFAQGYFAEAWERAGGKPLIRRGTR